MFPCILIIFNQDNKNELTSYSYDMQGNLYQITYPDSKTSTKQFDELGRVIKTTDANSKIQKFYYDANGNQVQLVDRNGNSFKYTYDGRNFLRKKDIADAAGNPLAGEESISFGYDQAGRRTSMIDATGTTSYNYNPVTGALNSMTYPDGRAIQYDYDAAGNRNAMTDPFGVNTQGLLNERKSQ